ncbi:TonB-dependent receptor [Microcoleus sp. FACHB-1515]|uniref:TonB-dependent receptor domain-containing protein n=1 Tax=Cyanophyceae TaxID=3028117 RepID=UPI00168A023F|nr:TonB-dependent receptor [Microcoleus sp. FACHB-1515]MBD2091490.1 TonB-dependent receptor [Microcoleus sp. FACHB-1515]
MLTQFRFLVWSVAFSALAAPAIASGTGSQSSADQPATTVEEWVSQIQQDESTNQAVIEITNVLVNPTETGVEIVLETAGGELSIPATQVLGNALIADIPNASIAEPFEQVEPTEGIAFVEVIGLPGRVRIAITGSDAPPTVNISTNTQQLIVSAIAGSEGDAIAEENTINVITTATRTEEELQDVPRSVTVITREEIDEQSRLTRNFGDILSQLLPGFSAPTGRTNTFGQTLRGREFSVLIDGIPQNTNLGSIPAALTTIDPQSIERIEVLRGPNAVYGGQATGGLINIITRRPEAGVTNTIEVGVNAAAGGGDSFLLGDSFGYNLRYSLSGTTGNFDWLGSLSYVPTGAFFDAEGDRIPSDLVNADTEELNGLIRLGLDLSEAERLQFTFNHFRQLQDTDVFSDPAIDLLPGIQEARAILIPDESRVIGAPEDASLTTTNLTLQYLNDDLLNSEVQGQIYYRNYAFVGGRPTDNREFFGVISQSPGETEQWGGRLQIDTPLDSEDTVSLLWGVDYVNENSSQRFNLFDPEEFDESGGLIFRKIDEIDFVPPYTLSDLGLFAQLQWELSDRLILSGGTRYVNLNISTNDYTTFDGNDIEGGTINADAFVFNAGVVFEFTDEISAFASFSQGFSLPDIGRVLRSAPPGFAVEADVDLTEPQRVDNYEIGVRGSWNSLQASIAGFYNYSALGTDFAAVPRGPLRTIRAPQRVYGIEAAIDWQPSNGWALGGTAIWLEGENDEDRDGDYLALNSITIPPFKLTTYVENETLSGWRNRLQLLFSGSRDRAFEDAVDGVPIESYVTLDFLSSIQVGEGELLIGIQNLLNEEYFPVFSQYLSPFADSLNRPGQGRTVSLTYRISF